MEGIMKPIPTLRHLGMLSALALLTLSNGAFATATDIANGPLASGVSGAYTVKPNVFFIVDDSLSMIYENMPGDDSTNKSNRCWGWYRYNTLFYNPSQTYKPPYKPDGTAYSDGVTRYPNATFTAALKDGYFPSGTQYDGSSNATADLSNTTNLTPNSLCYTLASSGSCASGSTTGKYYYSTYTGSGTTSSCNANKDYTLVTSSANIAAPGVTNGSAAALTNYANWYSYYRKRAFLVKAGTVEAFSGITDNYRVGLLFMGSVESGSGGSGLTNHDVPMADFSGSSRTNWFTKVLQSKEGYATPSRGALARAGRMYAGQISGWDPVQYSCQQNFAILSTDGYWNNISESGSYGPKQVNGTTDVGNVDGTGVAPHAATATLTVSGSGSTSVASITVNSVEILNGATAASTSSTTVASNIAAGITLNGYTATSSSGTVTITAPLSAGNVTFTPVVTKASGSSKTITATAFSGYTAGSGGAVRPYLDANNNPNTLADVAYYYYTNDLRTTNCTNTIGSTTYNNLCDNNVPTTTKDTSNQQHMTTFTVGLGVSGNMTYTSDYETATSGSYYNIKQGTANWPAVTNLGCISGCPELIDDLWHTAVNGRGTYYSASDPDTLKNGIQAALSGVSARVGSSAAAATSNLEPVAGDNFVYVALYRTQFWDGDVKAFTIDPDSGAIATSPLWSAQQQLDTTVANAGASADGRTIKFFSSGTSSKLKDFTYTNLSADGKGTAFTNFCSQTPAPAQCISLTTGQQTLANTGANLVNFLRGQNTYGATTNPTNPLYRQREHILGDIVSAVPVYAKKPPFSYDTYDTTYATFKSSNATRSGTVYVASNDGMLHAIDASAGTELWAFVPSSVMGNMWRLADTNYGNNHQYYVDGSPTLADICTSLDSASTATPKPCAAAGNWKTILIGGLNKGGCGYYALDVTDPASPKGLWEFTNANLGYTYGNPIVTRRADGTWVAIFTSGYNNVPGGCGSTGDGNGHVFVVDANTGALLEDIQTYTSGSTPAGSATTPSGLSKLNAWVENSDLNVASRLYGGDLLGNVWRIDFDNVLGFGAQALLLGQLQIGSGASAYQQPITTKPELAVVTSGGVTYPIVMVGTGKYLGQTDPADTHQQSIYALKDHLTSTGLGNVRTSSTFVSRTLSETSNSSGQTIRTVSGTDINWTTGDGWYIDLNPSNLSPTERVNVDMQLQFNILTVVGNVPENNVCTIGGSAWLYNINIDTGKELPTASNSALGLKLGSNALVAGIKVVKLASGKTVTIVTDTGGGISVADNPGASGSAAGGARRTMWREILD